MVRSGVADTGGVELEAVGRDAHAAGDHRVALDAYEAAYRAYRDERDYSSAARAARTVGWLHGWVFGEWAVYQGWSSQALTMLEQVTEDSAAGWKLCAQAQSGNDFETQRQQYLEAIRLAQAAHDEDLECEATASLGIMLVFSGLIEEGMAHLDRSLAAICGGGVQELSVVEGCLCGLFHACERTQDIDRAEQWMRATESVIQRGNHVAVGGHCRAHYAGVLVAAGRWEAAEAELQRAVELLVGRDALRASALCRLADLRLRQGRLEEAAVLVEGIEHHEDAIVPLARLHLAMERPRLVIELVDRCLAAGGLPDYVEAQLLAAAVDAHLACDEPTEALSAGERLSAIAGAQPAPAVRGLAAVTQARLCVASGEGDPRSCWHEAVSAFATARMPLERAVVRIELARFLAAVRPEVAIAEATAALRDLTEMGATRAADEAAALLRSLGAPARSGPKADAGLTNREAEVLALVGYGLTNSEIGDRLFISSKTVEHHVGRILAKLGVRSRAEAAAHAARSGNGGRA